MGGAAMTLGAALAGSALVGVGDRRGAVEPQAVAINVATSATANNFQCEVDPRQLDRTNGLYAMRIAPGDWSVRSVPGAGGARRDGGTHSPGYYGCRRTPREVFVIELDRVGHSGSWR